MYVGRLGQREADLAVGLKARVGGGEGVPSGLCSYLLISFWYTRTQANKAAIKALIVNRIADVALIIARVLMERVREVGWLRRMLGEVRERGVAGGEEGWGGGGRGWS